MTPEEYKRKRPPRRPRDPHPREEPAGSTGTLLRASFCGAGIALASGLLLLCILCAVCLSLDDPARTAPLFAYGALFPAALLCGILTAHAAKSRGLLSGLCGGALFCALLWALSFCLPDGETAASAKGGIGQPYLMTGICLLLSLLGGYAVTHRAPKSHKPKKR